MIASTTSLLVTPGRSRPSSDVTVIAIVLNGLSGSVCVASTCSTSDVPMPNAMAPNAPWVEVWESPQTTVMPGWVRPELRPDDVHDALLGVVHRVERDAELRAVAPQRLDLGARDLVGDRREHVERRDVVVLGGERQVGPAHRPSRQRRPSNACGLVTSWTRCRST